MIQDFHLIFYLNPHIILVKSRKKMLTLILNPQVYQAPESVMMNQRVQYTIFMSWPYLIPTASKQYHGSQLTTCNGPYL